ncbi:MAG: methyltransferase domain-containing protein [Candidatus Acidiferrum sp.]
MKKISRLLLPLYRSALIRSALKALTPRMYHGNVREMFKPAQGEHWCRIVMNREIEKFIRSLPCRDIDALEISGTGSRDKYDFRSYRSVSYPEYDVCENPLVREQFDLVIAEQVFEHILRPDKAAANVSDMLRPGGIFVISTPFLLKIHDAPLDLYRWTERGMRQLLEGVELQVLRTASWGNLKCLEADMRPGLEWTVFDRQKHSLENEPQFPIVVWAFAKKRMPH